MLVISAADVERLLPMEECIELMALALAASSEGKTLQPLRQVIGLPCGEDNVLSMMPGYLAEPEALGAKLVTVFPGNSGSEYSSHQGVVVLFDPSHGNPLAVINASRVTAIRTAAASGLATRLLAREDAERLLIVGSGEQAATHLAAMLTVRRITKVTVWGRNPSRTRAFACREGERHGVQIAVANSLSDAAAAADIVCTTTSATSPILFGPDIQPGTHLNVVGSSVCTASEIDAQLFASARVFVDLREATLAQGGDYQSAVAAGLINEQHILGEIGELVLGQRAGRTNDEEITLFKSLGVAVEDLVAANRVLERALTEGNGTPVNFN